MLLTRTLSSGTEFSRLSSAATSLPMSYSIGGGNAGGTSLPVVVDGVVVDVVEVVVVVVVVVVGTNVKLCRQ